jgi:aminopeptidase
VDGVELHFDDGRITKVSAIKGEKILRSVLESVPGADYIGELGIGTNRSIDRLTQDMLLDEKMWGTIHLALGAGYPETGSKNKSALHWDMLCDMRDGGKIVVDGELFYEAGEFQL